MRVLVQRAGKTMLAKAVAHHTTAAFIRVVGSEFVQKYLGEVTLSIHHVQCCLQTGKLESPASGCPHCSDALPSAKAMESQGPHAWKCTY